MHSSQTAAYGPRRNALSDEKLVKFTREHLRLLCTSASALGLNGLAVRLAFHVASARRLQRDAEQNSTQ